MESKMQLWKNHFNHENKMPNNTENTEPIRFYETSDEFGCFSNFSLHPIRLKGKTWPTSEHYFQAQKFEGSPLAEEIRKVKPPGVAFRLGHSRRKGKL